MIPSTAWSCAASSNTMLAPLPPSSKVILRPVPASSRWNASTDGGGPSERDLVDARVIDQRGAHVSCSGEDIDDSRR